VITTLHTQDATGTINRIIDVFPSSQQQQIRSQLAECLQGIIAQRLLPRIDQEGRIVAVEILLGTPAVRNVIREQRTEQIYTLIQTGVTAGMQLMDTSLRLLYRKGIISHASAVAVARNPQEIR
jgi:twitching motility protein PilT